MCSEAWTWLWLLHLSLLVQGIITETQKLLAVIKTGSLLSPTLHSLFKNLINHLWSNHRKIGYSKYL